MLGIGTLSVVNFDLKWGVPMGVPMEDGTFAWWDQSSSPVEGRAHPLGWTARL